MINSIELENWKTHGSTRLSFSKGTNILIGQMGAGKSSIMDAISFALFGTFPALKNRRMNTEGLIRNRPNQKRRARVKLSFTIGDDKYIVEREIAIDETARAKLERNSSYLQSQPQRVTEEIEKVLKMDYDLFSRAIYSEQNRLDYFLELRSSERKKQIDNLLGLDRFATAQENTTSLINKIREMAGEEERTAEGLDLESLNKQLAKLSEEKEKLLEEKKSVQEKLKELESKADSIGSHLKSLKDKYNRKVRLEKELAELRSKISVIGDEIRKIDSQKLGQQKEIERLISEKESEIKKAKEGVKECASLLQITQTRWGKLQGELSLVVKNMAEKERLTKEMEGKESGKIRGLVDKASKELERLDSDLAQSLAKKEDTERSIGELERHISRCPVCERELSPEMRKSLLDSKRALIKELQLKAKNAKDARTRKKGELEGLNTMLSRSLLVEEKLNAYANLDNQKKKMENELDEALRESIKAKEKADEQSETIAKLNDWLASLKNSKETLERRASYAKESERLEREMNKKRLELEETAVDEKKIDDAQREYTETISESSRCKASAAANESALDDKSSQMEEKRKEVERINKIYDDIRSKHLVVDSLSKFKNSLQETQAILRNRLVSSINGIMQEIWPELYPYGDYPGLMFVATEDDYLLKVSAVRENEAVWEDVEAIASGGERSIACLAMRVAFSLVLVPNLRWLILDEPTHNIDQLGISKFVRVFNEILPGIVDQIFIITHDEQLKQVSNGRIYMLSRNKDENKETATHEL